MALTGKTGADAIFKAVHHIVKVFNKYAAKFQAVTDQALTDGAITSAQHTTITTFISILPALDVAMEALAAFSGF